MSLPRETFLPSCSDLDTSEDEAEKSKTVTSSSTIELPQVKSRIFCTLSYFFAVKPTLGKPVAHLIINLISMN